MRHFTLVTSSSKENGFGVRVKSCLPSTNRENLASLGINSRDSHAGGSRTHLLERNNLDPASIASRLKSFVESN
jgi:transketolase C-terminal domain/subunit